MDDLLGHLGRMTHGRDRPMLELALTEALLSFLQLKCVRLYKCRQAAEETVVWLAVEVTPQGHSINDDGITTPENAVSVKELPQIRAFLQGEASDTPNENIMLPILMDNGNWFGFLELVGGEMDVKLLMTVGNLVDVFKNVMSLLDYSETDKLTGLLNRKTFDDYLLRILTHIELGDAKVAHNPQRRRSLPSEMCHWLGIIDIDHFKRVNDTYGHSIGDEVLLVLASLMRKVFRTNDKLFRFGGEEFVVLLKPAATEDALAAFERFRMTVQERVIPLVGHITVSIGYVKILPTDQRTQVFDRADQALYWAKQHGRNRVASYESLIASGELELKKDAGSIELF